MSFQVTTRMTIGSDVQKSAKGERVSYYFRACEKTRKNAKKDGKWATVFLNESRGKALEEYLVKGQEIVFQGELDDELYTPKDGGKPTISRTINVGDLFWLIGGSKRASEEAGESGGEEMPTFS